ncbi:leukocyte elastase inhibitor-like isoform X2 [Styela clava]
MFTFSSICLVLLSGLLISNVYGTANIYSDAVEKLTAANSKFAVDLYREIIAQPKTVNVVFSPVSVSAALAMVKLGTKENSTKQIAEALHLKDVEASLINSAFGELNGLLFDKPKDNITLKGANGAFISKTASVLNDYRNALSVFGAKIEDLDFGDKTSVSHINKWISQETGDLIPNMLNDDDLDATTALVLVNTLYFTGEWHSGFSPMHTDERAFYVSHYRVINTHFMYQRGKFRFRYIESLNLQVLELPYVGQDISMYLFLPDNFDLASVEKNLNYENLTNWISNMEYETVDITLPKFKVEAGIELQKSLQNLGIKDIFSSGQADLSGISGDKSLFVDAIFHKGVLEVNPLGGLVQAEREEANRTPADKRIMFYADHPFIFLIKNMKSGVMYQLGAFKRPEGKEQNHDEL